jgi:hypothetical protein
MKDMNSEALSEDTRLLLNDVMQAGLTQVLKRVKEGAIEDVNVIIMLKELIGYSTPKLSANLTKKDSTVSISSGGTQALLDEIINEAKED